MKKYIILLLFVFCSSFAQQKVLIQEGTLVKCRLAEDINGKNLNPGDKINFFLDENIVKNDKVIIQKGAKIIGTVTEAKGSRMLGKKGKLEFTIDYLYLNDGTVVKLSSNVKANLKGSGVVVGATSVVLTPFALFIHGKNAKYAAGTVFETFVASDIEIAI